MPVVTADLDFNSVAKAKNLPTPTSSGDAANKAYVDSAIEGLAWKDSCRVATQSNTNLSSPGATIDGISMSSGDRVLVRNQTSAPANGIYLWNGSSTAMTRAADTATSADLEQAVTTVEEGSDAGATFRQTNVNFTLDSGSVTWTSFGTSAASASESTAGVAEIATQTETNTGTDDARIVTPAKLAAYTGFTKKYSTSIGDGAATSYVVTHNLGSKDVLVQCRYVSTDAQVIADITNTSTTTCTIVFAAAPTTNQIRVVVIG
jgi:hypothetical protein